MSRNVDAIVIGAGQAGPPLAVRLAKAGRRVVLIERDTLGGTCVNNGCTPTKAMIASARVAHLARRAADYGVVASDVSVDYLRIKARKDEIVATSVKSLGDWIDGTDNLELIYGEARFTGDHEVTVGDDILTAPQIFINAGARAVVPDWPGLAGAPYLTNASMMGLDELPEHLIIAGGSYVGLEFGQMLRRFGSRVTIIEHGDRLIAREDPEISDAVRDILTDEDIDFIFNADNFRVSGKARDITLNFDADGRPRELAGSHLLLAIGRRPNTDSLGLDAAGIRTDKRGYIEVNERLESNVEGIFALGDINGRGAFTHTSYNDYEIVADNLLEGASRSVDDRIMTYALYTDPPLGRVGRNEAQVREAGPSALVASIPMSRIGRAKERGETKGLLKLIADAETKRVLGASFLGIEGDEMIQAVVDIMSGGVTTDTIARTMHIHPTVSEFLPELMKNLKPLD